MVASSSPGATTGHGPPSPRPSIYDPATGTFSPTGSMLTPRVAHTATLSPDGYVLIAGGLTSAAAIKEPMPLASAEIYDPATGTFSPTGSMTTRSRVWQTATLLPDRRVLVAGRRQRYRCTLPSAEIYDPATGKFSPTGSMTTTSQRSDRHAALRRPRPGRRRLQQRRCATVSPPPSCTTRRPARSRPTGSMTTARFCHTATLLPDGPVLIAGGDDGGFMSGNNLASAEIYDPKTGKFSPTGT